MIDGVPTEVKTDEFRGCMRPAGVEVLGKDGHSVLVQSGAGLCRGFIDEQHATAGELVTTHRDPGYTIDGVVHCCVGNIPRAVAQAHELECAPLGL